MKKFYILFLLCLFLGSKCDSNDNSIVTSEEQSKSNYVLPYPIGKSYFCSLAWNAYSHTNDFKYAVDFAMSVGTTITAAREGTVQAVENRYYDDDSVEGHENYVIIDHGDNTFGRYAHLTHDGASVKRGDKVKKWDVLGQSGNSGSSGAPHLHFDVTINGSVKGSQTIKVLFSNTIAHPNGCLPGAIYPAL